MNQIPASPLLTRRQMLQVSGLASLGAAFGGVPAFRVAHAAEAAGERVFAPLNRFPRMVQEHFVEAVRQFAEKNNRAKRTLKSRAEAEHYVQTVRQKILRCFGPMPDKTPLNPRITRTVDRDTYRIENLIFESRPGFLVTGNLYIPKGRAFPLPGVIGVCGHSTNGKAAEAYQSFSQGLARMGYVVFIIDPIGQGERLQYVGPELTSRIGSGVREHLFAGNQQFLVGEFIGAWRAWDGIRALDYLLTREEVDPKHVGVTGNSGGGTMTTWLCGVESRWTMAAPSCFVTSFRRNLENELPTDTEQCPPKALALGLDHEDFLAALAPKPILILGKEKDYFDARGTEEAFARLRHLYGLLGAEENIGLFQGPTPHGYSRENREAMYRWFNRITGVSELGSEPELKIEADETLWCAPKGQVAPLNSRTVFSFTREKSQALAKKRAQLEGQNLKRAVAVATKVRPTRSVPEYRILRALPSRRYPLPQATSYAIETEPGIQALVYRLSEERHYSRPPFSSAMATLYVSHHSSDVELREEPFARDLVEATAPGAFYACDVRGIGESRPDTCGHDSFLNPYGSDYFYAVHSLMLDRPYVGQKTFDLIRVLNWIESFGHPGVHLAAKGWGTLPATFAAILSDVVTKVTLKNALASYTDLAESEDYDWPLSAFLPNVLAEFDLPDCYADLKEKNLRLVDPWGAKAGDASFRRERKVYLKSGG